MNWSVRWLWEVLSVLCLFCSLPGEGFVMKHLNLERSKNMELLKFVLHNNETWGFVLNQKIKLTYENRPLYHDTIDDGIDPEIKGKLRLFEDAEIDITPLPVIKRVTDKFAWLGSYTDYAVFVLHKALMCTTYEFLRLQIEIIALMENKYPEPDGVLWRTDSGKPLLEAWKSVVQFIDKVTALHGDLEILTDLSYEYTEFILENPGRAIHVLNLMAKEIDKTIDDQCDRADQKVIMKEFGVVITNEYLHGDGITYDEIKTIFNKIIIGMITMFDKLKIQTISMTNWSQILNFKMAVTEHINLYLKVNKLLEKDNIGRDILRERATKVEEKIRQLSEDTENRLVFEDSSEAGSEEKDT